MAEKKIWSLSFTINRREVQINDAIKLLAVAPKTINGNTMVPLRFVGESSNKEVSWDENTWSVHINSKLQPTTVQNGDKSSPEAQTTQEQDFTFRKTKWGMTKEEVRASEPSGFLFESANTIAYHLTISGIDVSLFYDFADNKLVNVVMNHNEKYSSNRILMDYAAIKTFVSELYGDPVKDVAIWKDEQYKNDPTSYYLAIASGELTFFTSWKTDDTLATQAVYGKSNTIILGVVIRDINYIEPMTSDK